MHHKKYVGEWECESIVNPEHSIEDHKDWCAENKFGVNNFGLDPSILPMSKTRHGAGLHLPCAVAHKRLS